MRKVCVVTGSRAEYGLLRWVLQGIKDDPELELQVLVTGSHLSPEFGLTYREIEKDGFAISRKVETLLSADSETGVAKAMGLGILGFSEALDRLRPDLLVVLGDRFEIFAAASAALVFNIPIAHIHGGETTEGAFDEAFRHSITKMSHLHFVAAEEYKRRVIQLGEQPDRVFLVGGLGIDSIKKLKLLDRQAFEESIDFGLAEKNLLITFHPVTLENSATEQMGELLEALEELQDTNLIFTMPNADNEGRALGEMVAQFVAAHTNAKSYQSLGQLRYLSALSHVDGVVGNSSSGLIEAPTFKIGTINIGDRQKGRLQASSIINCPPKKDAIAASIARLYDPDFKRRLEKTVNPYGDGGACQRVVETIKSHDLNVLKKKFYDLC